MLISVHVYLNRLKMTNIWISLVHILSCIITKCSSDSKRLLLTDQDLINSRFQQQLENTLQKQQALINSLSQRLQVKEGK